MCMFQKRRGMVIQNLLLLTICLSVFAYGLFTVSGTTKKTMDGEILKDQSLAIDISLSHWYASHGKKYPDNLTVLQDMGIIPKGTNLSQFSYQTNASADKYKLTVTLPSGSQYVSLGSNL